MNNPTDIEQRMSQVVTAMRFPLIFLMLVSHVFGFEMVNMTLDFTPSNIYHFVTELLAHNFATLCVCWFFVFSGYFFFKTLNEGGGNWTWLQSRWEKRFWSLVIPFFIWNLIPVLLGVVKTYVFRLAGLGDDGGITYLRESGPFYWFWMGPQNFPLWFMRDLICMSVLAPVFYWLFRRWKYIGLFLILLLYVSPYNSSFPGFNIRAIFYFGIGAWLGVWKYNLLVLCRKIEKFCWALMPVTLVLATCFNASIYHEWFLRLFYPFGMIFLMNVIDRFTQKKNRLELLMKLAEYVFFIYVTHEIFILGWTKGAYLRLLGDSLLAQSIRFVLVPFTVLFICMALYRILKQWMPKTLKFLMGGRLERK